MQILDVMLYDSSSDQSSSNEEDLLIDLAFAPPRMLGPRIKDIRDVECEQMFRYWHAMAEMI